MKTLLFLLVLLLCATQASAQARTILFDQYVSPADNDLLYYFSWQNFFQRPDSGISGGAVQVPLGGGYLQYRTLLDSQATGRAVGATIFFKYNSDSQTSQDRGFYVDLVPVLPNNALDTAAAVHCFFRQYGGGFELGCRQNFNGGSGFPNNQPVLNRHWYRFDMDFSKSYGPYPYGHVNLGLVDYGEAGLFPVLNGINIPPSLTVFIMTGSVITAARYALVVRADHRCGIRYLDNLTISSDQFLGVPALSAAARPLVYPTVTKDLLHLKTPAGGTGSADYLLCDGSGRLLRRGSFTGEETVSLAGLPAATYYLRLEREGQLWYAGKIVRE